MAKSEVKFLTLGVSEKFRRTVLKIAALQEQRLYQVCDELFQPVADKRLAMLMRLAGQSETTNPTEKEKHDG